MKSNHKPLLSNKVTSYDNEMADPTKHEFQKYNVKPYGRHVATAICLNYIIGTGCFGLQYAFVKTGIVLTTLFLFFGLLLSMISMNFTLESMARADGISNCGSGEKPNHRISYQKFDFSTIGKIFGGKSLQIFVQIVIVCYCIGTLWAYASVFSSSTASTFYSYVLGETCNCFDPQASTGCMNAYFISMMIYGVLVVGLVLMNVGDQAGIQMFLSGYRIVAIFIMLVTLVIKVGKDGGHLIALRVDKMGYMNWSNFGSGFGPTILAINCHYNVPDAIQPLQDKASARQVTFMALIISCTLYLALGMLGAIGFDNVNPLATLNWVDYTGCGNGWDSCPSNFLGITIQLLILLFPIVNVASAYPLIGITVGDNLSMSIPQKLRNSFNQRQITIFCRLIAVVPPLLLALLFKKLDFIFTIAGLFGFILGLSIPCIFQLTSIRDCMKFYGTISSATTTYHTFFSTKSVAWGFLIASIFITGVAIVTVTP